MGVIKKSASGLRKRALLLVATCLVAVGATYLSFPSVAKAGLGCFCTCSCTAPCFNPCVGAGCGVCTCWRTTTIWGGPAICNCW